MPPKNKKQSVTPNEKQGLIQPGKRVTKSASNGNLNGNIAGRGSNTPTPPLASNANDASDHSPETIAHDDTNGNSTGSRPAMAAKKSLDNLREGRVERPASAAIENKPGEGQQDRAAVAQDLDAEAAKQESSVAAASLERAATVIGPHTLQDVISILLLLLQLPPKALMFIQVCFVSLTLGSSAAGWSLPSLASSPDWFQGHGGNPSILTTLMADFVCFWLWFLLPIGKDLTLDLAQVYIAMSLGGGVAGGGGTPTLICFGMLGLSHVLRYKPSRQYTASILWTLMSKANFGPFKGPASFPILTGSAYAAHSWPRALLEIHIITQGVVRIIRRAVYRRIEPSTKSGKRVDTEALGSSSTNTISVTNDASADGARNGSTDGRQPGPSPAVRDNKEKSVSSGKKRRKQATFVRSQQPFWAAIANTKVTVSKEIEQSQASRDAYEADASNATQLGNGILKSFDDRVWVSQIADTEISYFASFAGAPDCKSKNNEDGAPLRIRVNNAPWKSTTCVLVDTYGDGTVTEGKHLFSGKISGLTAATNLIIEFVRTVDDQVLYSAGLVTRPVANSDQGVIIPPQPQEALRPASPTTTLNNAIKAILAKTDDVKERSKKTRRGHRTTTASLQSMIDSLESRINSSSGSDEKQKQREYQYTNSIRSAEEGTASINAQIDALGEVPEEDRESADASEKSWQEASKQIAKLRGELESCKGNADKEVGAAQTSSKAARKLREQKQARLAKLVEVREAKIGVRDQARRERIKRDQDRHSVLEARRHHEDMVVSNIDTMELDRRDTIARTISLEQNGYMWDTQPYAQPSYTQHFHERNGSLPHSPDVSYQALPNRAPSGFIMPGSAYRAGTPPIASSSRRGSLSLHRQPLGPGAHRHRSSSMLSDVSGFTEDDDPSPLMPAPAPTVFNVSSPPFAPNGGSPYFSLAAGMNYTTTGTPDVTGGRSGEGSGSGSGTGSGSGSGNLTRRGSEQDAPRMSPNIASAPRLSPIGSELRRGSPRNHWGR